MARVSVRAFNPHTEGPIADKLDEHDDALDAIDAAPGASFAALTDGVIVKNNAGVPADAVRSIDYIGPQKTADTASATTVTLPLTGMLVPITGSVTMDFFTKPTGDAPRYVILWLKAVVAIRHEVAGAGAGAANVSLVPGAAANYSCTFPADSFLPLVFDGTVWRRADSQPHWNGSTLSGLGASSQLVLDPNIGARLQFASAANSVTIDSVGMVLTGATTVLTTRPKLTKGSVAAGSNVALPANCPYVLITGTGQTINTFTATGWQEGMPCWLRFDGANTITDNSGGANDFVAKTAGNITTAAGMVLPFFFDGTDMKEVGR